MAKVAEVRIDSHIEEFTDEMKQKVEAFLMSIGETAAASAADIPNFPVDTGRMKNSINWATHYASGHGDTPLTTPEECSVYIGTNVEYAPFHELGTSRGIPARHFIQYGAQSSWNSGIKDELEQILKQE